MPSGKDIQPAAGRGKNATAPQDGPPLEVSTGHGANTYAVGNDPGEASDHAPPLATEVQIFERERVNWLESHQGEYVLIMEQDVVGFFRDRDEALAAGYDRSEKGPFLVQEVVREERLRYAGNVL